MNPPQKSDVIHYTGFFCLYVGHVLRYVKAGDFFNARRSAGLADGALTLATRCDIPEGWKGYPEDLAKEAKQKQKKVEVEEEAESIPPEPEPIPLASGEDS